MSDIEKAKVRKIIELTATVDDDRRVWGMDTDVGHIDDIINQALSALDDKPACQKPPASEFTKECRELIKTEGDDKGWTKKSGYIVWLETTLEIACSRLDAQQQRIKELEAEKTCAWEECGGLNENLAKLTSRLAKRDEAIRVAVEHLCWNFPATPHTPAAAKIKRILGDEYKEIMKGE